jgi:hypothetical protein
MFRICAPLLALTLTASPVLAAENGALPPGRPAGVLVAQKSINAFYVVTAGAGLLGLGALLISSQHSAIGTIAFSSSGNDRVIPVNNTVISTSTTGTN